MTISIGVSRVADLWYEEGTLVLQVESSLFKVFRGILSKKSGVFRDMLSVPAAAPGSQEMVGGCPLIRLYDSPEDMTYFLKALHDTDFFLCTTAKTEFAIVAGILRLADKYDAPSLRQRAIEHILTAYPMSLDRWDQRGLNRSVLPEKNLPFAVLELARKCDVRCILPAVLYSCCTYTLEDILDGVEWRGTHVEMSWEDKRLCLLAREKLRTGEFESVYRFLAETSGDECGDENSCGARKLRWLHSRTENDKRCTPLQNDFDWVRFGLDVCDNCLNSSKLSHAIGRKALWEELPQIFGLPSWEKLVESRFD